jgi:hypothetical protein
MQFLSIPSDFAEAAFLLKSGGFLNLGKAALRLRH